MPNGAKLLFVDIRTKLARWWDVVRTDGTTSIQCAIIVGFFYHISLDFTHRRSVIHSQQPRQQLSKKNFNNRLSFANTKALSTHTTRWDKLQITLAAYLRSTNIILSTKQSRFVDGINWHLPSGSSPRGRKRPAFLQGGSVHRQSGCSFNIWSIFCSNDRLFNTIG